MKSTTPKTVEAEYIHKPIDELPDATVAIFDQVQAPGTSSALAVQNSEVTLRSEEWAAAWNWANAAERFAKASIAAQVMCGFELLALRQKYGTNQGKRRDLGTSPSDLEKLDWPTLVKKNIGKSDETARTWMAMAEAVKPRLKKMGNDGAEFFAHLMEVPINEWTLVQVEMLTTTVEKITDGRTQMEFLLECGVTKAPHGSGAKGGKKESNKNLSKEEQLIEAAQILFLPLQLSMGKAAATKGTNLVHLPLETDTPNETAALNVMLEEIDRLRELVTSAINLKQTALRGGRK